MKKKIFFGIIAVLVIFAFIGSGSEDKQEVANTETEVVQTQTEEVKKEKVSAEFLAALGKATMYANTMDMSMKGVYDQLVSEYGENFPKEAAIYAIEHVRANWKENALNKAKMYQETMNMSRKSIYQQLVSQHGEKFRKEAADYALENLPR